MADFGYNLESGRTFLGPSPSDTRPTQSSPAGQRRILQQQATRGNRFIQNQGGAQQAAQGVNLDAINQNLVSGNPIRREPATQDGIPSFANTPAPQTEAEPVQAEQPVATTTREIPATLSRLQQSPNERSRANVPQPRTSAPVDSVSGAQRRVVPQQNAQPQFVQPQESGIVSFLRTLESALGL